MPLNDQKAIDDLVSLYDELETRAKVDDPENPPSVEELRRFKAEETVKIFKAYIQSGEVTTSVSGATSSGEAVTGQGTGSITS